MHWSDHEDRYHGPSYSDYSKWLYWALQRVEGFEEMGNVPIGLKQWYAEEKIAVEKRKAQKEYELQQQKLKQQAVAKLTDEERKALRL